MAEIVPYKVAFATSEEDETPASELLAPGPSSRGWATAKYCIYPQDLILQMEGRTVIERIQILSSSTLVTSSIQVYIGADGSNPEDPQLKEAKFMHIGDLQFLDPAKTELRGRQLQTIELQGNDKLRVHFIKFSLKHNHMHKLNEFNQVSLMAISILGKMKKANSHSRSPSRTRNEEFSAVPRRQDLAFLMYTDKDIAELIHQLEERKYEAVNCEQFENARKLKAAIDELLIAGQSIGALDVQKQNYADEQNYAQAKDKKEELEKARDDLYKELQILELLALPLPRSKPTSPKDLPPPIRIRSHTRSPITRSPIRKEAEVPEVTARKPLPPPIDRKISPGTPYVGRQQEKKRKVSEDNDDEARF